MKKVITLFSLFFITSICIFANNTKKTLDDACFSVYPNPATSVINIDWFDGEFEGSLFVSFLTDVGKMVDELIIDRYEHLNDIDISFLDPGNYYIQITDQNGSYCSAVRIVVE